MTIAFNRIDVENLNTYHDWSILFEGIDWYPIAEANWVESYPYRPKVKVQAIHSNQYLVLHYEVQEEYVKAQYIRPNENVWEDSCVEFFISFDQRKSYYNVEFNPLGTGLIGYGTKEKSERSRLPDDKINMVSTYSSVSNQQGNKVWRIILVIPTILFFECEEADLSGKKAYANFYKCGDELPHPHFLSWKAVGSPTPNFHLPEFFGEVVFE